MSPLEEELYLFSATLLEYIKSNNNDNIDWAEYHLWRAFQGRIELQEQANSLHDLFKKTFKKK